MVVKTAVGGQGLLQEDLGNLLVEEAEAAVLAGQDLVQGHLTEVAASTVTVVSASLMVDHHVQNVNRKYKLGICHKQQLLLHLHHLENDLRHQEVSQRLQTDHHEHRRTEVEYHLVEVNLHQQQDRRQKYVHIRVGVILHQQQQQGQQLLKHQCYHQFSRPQ